MNWKVKLSCGYTGIWRNKPERGTLWWCMDKHSHGFRTVVSARPTWRRA